MREFREHGGEHPEHPERQQPPPVMRRRITITVNLPAEFERRLRSYADSRNQSLDVAVEVLLERALDQLPKMSRRQVSDLIKSLREKHSSVLDS